MTWSSHWWFISIHLQKKTSRDLFLESDSYTKCTLDTLAGCVINRHFRVDMFKINSSLLITRNLLFPCVSWQPQPEIWGQKFLIRFWFLSVPCNPHAHLFSKLYQIYLQNICRIATSHYFDRHQIHVIIISDLEYNSLLTCSWLQFSYLLQSSQASSKMILLKPELTVSLL